ncbi:hypothetical protein V8C42DRAFT_224202 [Trichoderma barbatum]
MDCIIRHLSKHLAQKKKYDARTKNAVQHHLSSNSNGTFLWVALVCQNLEKISLQNTLRKLNEFPPGLDSLYKRMIKQIHNLEDVSDAKFCYQILATVLLVYRPVTLAELGTLIESPDDNPIDAELIDNAMGFCGSFLTVRESRVYVIHQSAKDYLSDNAAPIIFPSSSASVHNVIFARSLQAMSVTLRRNIYNLNPPGLPVEEMKAPDPDPLAAVRYSCVHWVDHFCYVYNSNGQPQDQVDHKCKAVFLFLQKYFLYWFEALGLMGYIEDGVLSMARLESLLKGKAPNHQSSDCQLTELAQDSRRFIRQTSLVFADSPLQVYTSALIFSPLNSLVRKFFKEEEPQWLKVKPTVDIIGALIYKPFRAIAVYSGQWPSQQMAAILHQGQAIKLSRSGTITGTERQTLKVNTTMHTISFDDTTSYLHTEVGPIKFSIEHRTEARFMMVAQVLSLDSDPAQQRQRIANNAQRADRFCYSLSFDKCWITWNEHNILWLPPEYQPFALAIWPYAPPFRSSEVPLMDVVIALGSRSGRVVVIGMSNSGPYPLL